MFNACLFGIGWTSPGPCRYIRSSLKYELVAVRVHTALCFLKAAMPTANYWVLLAAVPWYMVPIRTHMQTQTKRAAQLLREDRKATPGYIVRRNM
jgi:hypothetical protein